MGNNKFFKLSDMIPNAWFHKLKHNITHLTKSNNKHNTKPKTKNDNKNKNNLTTPITATTTTTTKTTSPPKLDPPRKSSKRRSVSSSSSSRRRRPPFTSVVINNSSESENDASSFLRLSSSTADIIIDLKSYHPPTSPVLKPAPNHNHNHNNNKNKNDVVSDYDGVDLVDLPPILTKPINFDDKVFEAATKSYNRSRARAACHGGQKPSVSAGIRLRSANSPRVAAAAGGRRRSVSYRRERKCLTQSFAVVKASVDPQRDFRESMVEMIVENNIRASKDLEELLACFLSLNSKEYHDVIVNAFEQIWFDMSDIRIM